MPSSDLSHWLLLAQRLFHDLVALLCVPSTRFGHLFPPAGSPAFLWPSYSHLSRVPNLMGRDNPKPTTPIPQCSKTVPCSHFCLLVYAYCLSSFFISLERVFKQCDNRRPLQPFLARVEIQIVDFRVAQFIGGDVIFWNIDAQRIDAAETRFIQFPLQRQLSVAREKPIDENARGVRMGRVGWHN